MDNTTKIEKFIVDCRDCRINKRPQDSMLYIDWEKKYYTFTCLNCNTMEAFDKFSKRIELKKAEPKLQVN